MEEMRGLARSRHTQSLAHRRSYGYRRLETDIRQCRVQLLIASPSGAPRRSLSGRHSVEDLAQGEAAGARHRDWGLMLAWVSYAVAFSSLTYHFFPLLLERGLDTAGAVLVLMVIGPAQVAAHLDPRLRRRGSRKVGRLGDRHRVSLAVVGFAFAPPEVLVIAAIAAFYGAANGMITIVRGMAVPEIVTRDCYGAVNGSLVAPMNIMSALAPLGAALLCQASGSYGAVLAAIFVGSLTLCAGFWFAAARSKR
jgi:MFS family permease